MCNLMKNNNFIMCVLAVVIFVATRDAAHLRESIQYGLQAVLDAKAGS